jgi:hypothetical protein
MRDAGGSGGGVVGGFILITRLSGAMLSGRSRSVEIIHDASECHSETIVQLRGGHVARVPATLDEVVEWFC